MKSLLASLSVAVGLLGTACTNPDEIPPFDAPTDVPVVDTAIFDTGGGDTMIDADPLCGACTSSQICVQYFNGTCGDRHVECQPRVTTCIGTTCSPECDFWHCDRGVSPSPYSCGVATCPGLAPNALHCFGA